MPPPIYRVHARPLRAAILATIVLAQDAHAGGLVGRKGRRNVDRKQSLLPGEAARAYIAAMASGGRTTPSITPSQKRRQKQRGLFLRDTARNDDG
jgi:hypothetical protein